MLAGLLLAHALDDVSPAVLYSVRRAATLNWLGSALIVVVPSFKRCYLPQ
jgi:hypothetical protein